MTGVYELLDKTARSAKVVVRDDQFEFNEILDAAKAARSRRRRIKLLDTGRFSATELEWLGEAGIRFFTSNETRKNPGELRLIRDACTRGGSGVAFLVKGPIAAGGEDPGFSLAVLQELARLGIVLHVSNREFAVDPAVISALAAEGRVVYYHHGALVPELAVAARRGIRLHVSDEGLDEKGSEAALEILAGSRAGRGRVYIYIQNGLPLPTLRVLADAGAKLLFKTPPSDSQSLLRPIERRFVKTAPAAEDYYLDSTFLL
jgi:hypothetical protein